MLNKITNELISKGIKKAKELPRQRHLFCFHKEDDVLQRMVNCCLKNTYVRPHKHPEDGKWECFVHIRGKSAVVSFDDNGKIIDTIILGKLGQKVAEVPPYTWHMLISLSGESIVYEVINGKYNPNEHKVFAKWSPEEGTEESIKYLNDLKNKIL